MGKRAEDGRRCQRQIGLLSVFHKELVTWEHMLPLEINCFYNGLLRPVRFTRQWWHMNHTSNMCIRMNSDPCDAPVSCSVGQERVQNSPRHPDYSQGCGFQSLSRVQLFSASTCQASLSCTISPSLLRYTHVHSGTPRHEEHCNLMFLWVHVRALICLQKPPSYETCKSVHLPRKRESRAAALMK